MFTVEIWGDSIFKGIIFDERANKYVTLQHGAISDAATRLKLNVKNFSQFGQTIVRAKNKFLNKLGKIDPKEKPDAVLFELGGNDCDFNWKEVADDPFIEHLPNTRLCLFEQTLRELAQTAIEKGIKPVFATLPPLDSSRYFSWITKDGLPPEKILTWLKNSNVIYSWHESYNLAVLRVARYFNVPVIAIREAFLERMAYSDLLCIDGIHPNATGQALIADVICDFYQKNFISEEK